MVEAGGVDQFQDLFVVVERAQRSPCGVANGRIVVEFVAEAKGCGLMPGRGNGRSGTANSRGLADWGIFAGELSEGITKCFLLSA